MPLSSSLTLNNRPSLRPLPGEQDTGSKRSAQSDSPAMDSDFEDYLDREIGGQTLASQWLQAAQLQNFLPNFMLALPSVFSVWPLNSAPAGMGGEGGGAVGGESDTAAARFGPRAPASRESSNPSIERASAAKSAASQAPEESRSAEQNRAPDQEESRSADQKTRSNRSERTETASNREPKEAESSKKPGETAVSPKETAGSKESGAGEASSSASEGTDSGSRETGFGTEVSGAREPGEPQTMELRKAAMNGQAAQPGTAPAVPTQHTEGGPQAAGPTGRVEGASAAGKVSAIAETGKTGASQGSNGSNSSSLQGQAGQPAGTAPAGAAPGTSAINGSAPSGKASESELAGRTLPSQVPEQILKGLHRAILNGDREIQIRLDPPELGSLRLNLSQDDGGLSVVIETSSETTRQALDAALPDLRRMLQDEGIRVQNFLVQDWREENPSGHEGWHDPSQGGNGDSGGGLSGEDEATSDTPDAPVVSGLLNDRRVNMVA